jgi:hypothetical protein
MLSENALAVLRKRLEGDDRVTAANRDGYRELEAAGIMYPVSTFTRGPEAIFRFTEEGWNRRFDFLAGSEKIA